MLKSSSIFLHKKSTWALSATNSISTEILASCYGTGSRTICFGISLGTSGCGVRSSLARFRRKFIIATVPWSSTVRLIALKGFPSTLKFRIFWWNPRLSGKLLILLFSRFNSRRIFKLLIRASGRSTILFYARFKLSIMQNAGEHSISNVTIWFVCITSTLKFGKQVKDRGSSVNRLPDKSSRFKFVSST